MNMKTGLRIGRGVPRKSMGPLKYIGSILCPSIGPNVSRQRQAGYLLGLESTTYLGDNELDRPRVI